MKEAFIIVGVSGSGKSTICEALAIRYDANVFSLDSCRIAYCLEKEPAAFNLNERDRYAYAFKVCSENGAEFSAFVNKTWSDLLQHPYAIIVDNTNITKKSRVRWVTDLRRKGFKVTAVQVYAPLDVVLERQKTRTDKQVPESAVRDMYFRFQEVVIGEEADELLVFSGTADQLQF